MAAETAQAVQPHVDPAAPHRSMAADPALDVPRRRFTVDEYHRMGQAGILGPEERVELIDGEIVQMSPIGPRHAHRVNRLTRVFSRRLGDAAIVSVQNPIQLTDHSEPQPDVALLRPRLGYARAHPGPRDVLLVVEVSDTSADYDRDVKLLRYARAGLPEVWLLSATGASDVAGGVPPSEPVLQVFRQPGPQGYAEIRLVRPGERITLLALPEIEIAVDELLDDDDPQQHVGRGLLRPAT